MMELTIIQEKSESMEMNNTPKILSPKVQTPELQPRIDPTPDLFSS